MADLFKKALALEPTPRPPVWFMRQAGRCLPAYRALRREHSFQALVADPELAARATLLPTEYFPVDALVIFQDLSTPFPSAGVEIEMRAGVGPVPLPPWQGPGDVHRLQPFEPRESLDHVLEAIRLVAAHSPLPVIGFVGAPFTLCSYLCTGNRDSRLTNLRAFMIREPRTWDRLARFWADHLAEFAIAQAEAGAAAIQLFDSWCGVLGAEVYREFVQPHSRKILSRLREAGVPTIHYGSAHGDLLSEIAAAGGNLIGIDWRTPLDQARRALCQDGRRGLQGNLDPAALLGGHEAAVRETQDVLRRAGGMAGHVFNTGHGLRPDTDPAVVAAVVRAVRDWPSAKGSAPGDS